MSPLTTRFRALAAAGILVLAARSAAPASDVEDLTARAVVAAADPSVTRLKRLSIEELMDLEVSSVSKAPERQREAAAAVFVITGDDIRRSGVRTLADALRLAPGVHVSKIDANKWAVGIRGFGTRFSRSVLVLVDGRSVYTPLFAGTYWEVQDVLLADVDRIEVIRGPGGTLWGANAVSGVINIITKSARDTHGGLVEGLAGSEHRWEGALRHGGETEGGVHWRAWAKAFERDAGWREDDVDYDDWGMARAGFRLDWDDGTGEVAAAAAAPSDEVAATHPGRHGRGRLAPGQDTYTVQGDAYEGRAGQRSDVVTFGPPFLDSLERDADLGGGHVLGRWSRGLASGGETSLQTYVDWTYRDENVFRESRGTFDVDFQHRTGLLGRHELIWGANYRITRDDVRSMDFLGLDPDERTASLVGAFIQDEVVFRDGRVHLTYGAKIEKSDFSDVELQPNVRILWTPEAELEPVFWAALSRAVRTASRIEEDLALTQATGMPGVFTRLIGPGDFESEKVTALEAGVRLRPWRGAFLDIAAFYNQFDDLQGFETGTPFPELVPGPPHLVVPLTFENSVHGDAIGVELAAAIDLGEAWRLHVNWSYVDIDLLADPHQADTLIVQAAGQVPRHQVVVRSHADLGRHWMLDAIVRWVDDLPADDVDDYVTADVRVAWSPRPGLEVAVVGHDLFDSHHREAPGPQVLSTFGGSEVQRGIYGIVTWRY